MKVEIMWFECACGTRIHDISDSHSFKGRIIADKNWETFWNDVDEAIEKSGPSPEEKEHACMNLRFKGHHTATAYQCHNCGRIHIAAKGTELMSFKPELESTSKKIFDIDADDHKDVSV